MKREDITPEILRELLDYNPETGVLRWKERDRKWFKTDSAWNVWSARYSGREAFTTTSLAGYKCGAVLKVQFLAHRVAWAIHFGVFPTGEVDHVDGNPSNNRLNNLRDATSSQNKGNTGPQKNNTSGFKGVSYEQLRGVWRAKIMHRGGYHFLGFFNTPEEAARAYDQAAIQHFGEFAKLNFPEAA